MNVAFVSEDMLVGLLVSLLFTMHERKARHNVSKRLPRFILYL